MFVCTDCRIDSMVHHPARRSRCAVVSLIAALLSFARAEAQTVPPELRQVRWPLLDMVMVPDSAGLWFMVAPNPATRQWESGSHLVKFGIDPVVALQWVTLARGLTSDESHPPAREPAHLTPPLQAKRGPAFVLLANNPKKPSSETKFVFVVSDSATHTQWKSFASSAQVNAFLTALELTAIVSREGSYSADWNTLADQDPDAPVTIVSQPRPVYPARLASRGRVGRVWMTYVISADGRVEQGSFLPLLSDDSLFTRAAIEALLRGRFRPAVSNGQPVPQRVFQVITFRTR
jgi:TonB family protein